MQIIGFNFEKITAERKKPSKGKLEITSNISIETISEEKIDLVKDQTPLKFGFAFSVNYNPDMADINLNGSVLVLLEKNKAKQVIKKWKSKKIEDDIRIPLFNLILTRSNLKALQLEEELQLPTHIPFPKIQAEKDNSKSYAG